MGLFSKKSGPVQVERLVLEGELAQFSMVYGGPGGRADFQDQVPADEFLRELQRQYELERSLPLGLIPQGLLVRATHHRNGIVVVLVEVEPGPRTMQWLRDDSPAQYGSGATYRDVHISLPWQYFFIALHAYGTLAGASSVYFRNEPIRTLADPLYDCHFYNCSVRAYGVYCWICTAEFEKAMDRSESLFDVAADAIRQFYFGGFNRSSEYSEGASFWGTNRKRMSDRRVRTIEVWHDATVKDPTFAVTVPWVPSPHTVESVYEELTSTGNLHAPRTAGEMARLVTVCKQTRRARKGE